jgi:hypothetical protein
MLRLIGTLILCSQLQGCFFFFLIPGAVIDKTADAVTGARGENCVAPTVKVGDQIRLVDGTTHTVKSISGTSYRCQTARFPIRAELI